VRGARGATRPTSRVAVGQLERCNQPRTRGIRVALCGGVNTAKDVACFDLLAGLREPVDAHG
jgi:hypothetical protein